MEAHARVFIEEIAFNHVMDLGIAWVFSDYFHRLRPHLRIIISKKRR